MKKENQARAEASAEPVNKQSSTSTFGDAASVFFTVIGRMEEEVNQTRALLELLEGTIQTLLKANPGSTTLEDEAGGISLLVHYRKNALESALQAVFKMPRNLMQPPETTPPESKGFVSINMAEYRKSDLRALAECCGMPFRSYLEFAVTDFTAHMEQVHGIKARDVKKWSVEKRKRFGRRLMQIPGCCVVDQN